MPPSSSKVAVCPTGVLRETVDTHQLQRFFSASLCTQCGLCQGACPEHIIEFDSEFSDTQSNVPEEALVATVRLAKCVVCGDCMLDSDGNICLTRQKRQLIPMFIEP